MSHARSIAVLLLAGTQLTSGAELPEVVRVFLQLPTRYVAVTHRDRRWWVREIDFPRDPWHTLNGRNLTFSFDGEEPLSGEGPFIVHLLASPPRKQYVALYRAFSSHQPVTRRLYVLYRSGGEWSDVTHQVVPQPIDTSLHYDLSSSDDSIRVCEHDEHGKSLFSPGRVLQRWRWRGSRFEIVP